MGAGPGTEMEGTYVTSSGSKHGTSYPHHEGVHGYLSVGLTVGVQVIRFVRGQAQPGPILTFTPSGEGGTRGAEKGLSSDRLKGHAWVGFRNILACFESGRAEILAVHEDASAVPGSLTSATLTANGLVEMDYADSCGRLVVTSPGLVCLASVAATEIVALPGDTLTSTSGGGGDRGGGTLAWTKVSLAYDGTLVAAARPGCLAVLVAALPPLSASFGTSIAWISSLSEISVSTTDDLNQVARLTLATEPACIATGDTFVAAALNTEVWFHSRHDPDAMPVHRDFVNSVDAVALTAGQRGGGGGGGGAPGGRAPPPPPRGMGTDAVAAPPGAASTAYAAVLTGGRLHVCPAAEGGTGAHAMMATGDSLPADDVVVLPTRQDGSKITCVAGTESCFVYGTDQGKVVVHHPAHHVVVDEYSNGGGAAIRHVWPNTTATRVLYTDTEGRLYLLSPASGVAILVTDVGTGTLGVVRHVLWDLEDPHVFAVFGKRQVEAYVYVPTSVHGATVRPLGVMAPASVLHDAAPIAMRHGSVLSQGGGGSIRPWTLPSHVAVAPGSSASAKEQFETLLKLGRVKAASEVARASGSLTDMTAAAFAAMDVLDLRLAISLLRMTGEAPLVLTLSKLVHLEDTNLLAGHMLALIHQDYDNAQRHFLVSSQRTAALELRRDLRQWDLALDLARDIDPDSIAEISAEYGQMLETRCDFDGALEYYQNALSLESNKPSDARDDGLVTRCQAGQARSLIHAGQVAAGKAACRATGDVQLCKDCAHILETKNHFTDSAELYLAAGALERAAGIYIRAKNWSACRPLLAKIKSVQIHGNYAAAMVVEGKYADALASYEVAGDWPRAVGVLLDRLKDPNRAAQVARKSRNAEAARMVARWNLNHGHYKVAIEFLVLGGRIEDAFEAAKKQDSVDWFLTLVGPPGGGRATTTTKASAHPKAGGGGGNNNNNKKAAALAPPGTPMGAAGKLDIPPGTLISIAEWLQEQQRWLEAARWRMRAREWQAAVHLLLRDPSPEALDEAMSIVETYPDAADIVRAHLEQTHSDQTNKYMFRLELARGKLEEAVGYALEHAAMQREMLGDYRAAHKTLFMMYTELRTRGRPIYTELVRALHLLHSYLIGRHLVRLEDHVGAARMLSRVAASISLFPQHVVPILTSTVVECQRAGLKNRAFEHAVTLMQPEYKSQVHAQYRRKIEMVVRKRVQGEELPEEEAPCLSCQVPGPATELECGACRSLLPMCIATGKRVLREDWAQCGSCRFPFRATVMRKVVAEAPVCPMCAEPLEANQIVTAAPQDANAMIERVLGQLGGGGAGGLESGVVGEDAPEEDIVY